MRSLCVVVLLAAPAAAADWAQFRGPNGSAVSAETNLPVKWSASDGLRWRAELPSRGVSSPVVAGDVVYVTCSSGPKDDRLHVLAFDLKTGKKRWHRQLAATGGTNCHPTTCMAAPTPVADESGVYALFATGDAAAFTPDGTLRWYRSLVGDYPTVTNQVGMASSPVLAAGKLIVPMDNSGESFLAALDPKTGKNVWKTERPRGVNWVTPAVRPTSGGTPEILMPGAGELAAYDAETGKKLWAARGLGSDIPSPTTLDGVVYVSAGGVKAVRPDGGTAKEVWASPKLGSGMSSPLVYAGFVYAATPAGVLNAADAATGKVVWGERYKGKVSASPVAADGKVYVLNETGTTTVFKAGAEAEKLAENDLGEETLATPAVAVGAILIRTDKALYCVGAK